MNVKEALLSRRSVRAFKPDPIEKETILSILTDALHAPSWANSQPWEVFVASGETLAKIKAAYIEHYKSHVVACPDVPRPKEWPEVSIERRNQLGPDMKRDCGEAAKEFGLLNQTMFNAPAVIYLCLDKALDKWSLFDLGAFQQSVMLSAMEHGLGTIPAITLVHFPEILRRHLEIPEHLSIALGIAIGHTDTTHEINRFRSARKSLDETVRLIGF